jgi:hypothetical protein
MHQIRTFSGDLVVSMQPTLSETQRGSRVKRCHPGGDDMAKPWSEIRSKISPERREGIDLEVREELERMRAWDRELEQASPAAQQAWLAVRDGEQAAGDAQALLRVACAASGFTLDAIREDFERLLRRVDLESPTSTQALIRSFLGPGWRPPLTGHLLTQLPIVGHWIAVRYQL